MAHCKDISLHYSNGRLRYSFQPLSILSLLRCQLTNWKHRLLHSLRWRWFLNNSFYSSSRYIHLLWWFRPCRKPTQLLEKSLGQHLRMRLGQCHLSFHGAHGGRDKVDSIDLGDQTNKEEGPQLCNLGRTPSQADRHLNT